MYEKARIFLQGTEEKNISYLIELFLYQYVLRQKYPLIIVKNIPRYFAFGSWKKNSIHCKKFWAKYLEFFYIRVKKNLMFYTDKLILKISKMILHSKGDKNYIFQIGMQKIANIQIICNSEASCPATIWIFLANLQLFKD